MKTNLTLNPSSTMLKAFTIVELLVVIVVIGILASITILSYTGITNKAIASSLQSDLTNASRQLDLFQVEHDYYPLTIDCSIPDSDTNKCIRSNTDPSPVYIVNNSLNPPGFCVSMIKNNISYVITESKIAQEGDCENYGLVLLLDAGNTASYPGNGTAWYDLSELGNDSVIVNGATYLNNNGVLSFSFDGIDDYVYLPNSSNFYYQNYTYLAWVNISNFGTGSDISTIFSKWGSSSSRTIQVNLHINSSGKIKSSVAKSSGDTIATILTGSTSLTLSNWYMVACTFSNGVLKVWLNGVLDGSINTGYASIANGNTAYLHIGKFDFTWTGYKDEMTGKIGYAKVYNREISSDEMLSIFNETKGNYGL